MSLRPTRCIFDPSRACGSFVRTKNAYTRKDLIQLANNCGVVNVRTLSMQALCQILREKFFQTQKSAALLSLFYENRLILPGHNQSFQHLVNNKLNGLLSSPADFSDPVPFVLLSDIVEDLLPMPKNFVFVRTQSSLIFLTTARAADILRTPTALRPLGQVLRKIVTWMQLGNEQNYRTLRDACTEARIPLLPICQLLIRLFVAVSVFVGTPTITASIFGLFCPRVSFQDLKAYTQDFSHHVKTYTGADLLYPEPAPVLPAPPPQPLVRPTVASETSTEVSPSEEWSLEELLEGVDFSELPDWDTSELSDDDWEEIYGS